MRNIQNDQDFISIRSLETLDLQLLLVFKQIETSSD